MAALLSALAVLTAVNAQAYDSGSRAEDAFSYVQPLNTTILGDRGHSPAVYPSREYLKSCALMSEDADGK